MDELTATQVRLADVEEALEGLLDQFSDGTIHEGNGPLTEAVERARRLSNSKGSEA